MTDKTVTDLTRLIRMMQGATEHHPKIFPAHPELAGKVKYYLLPPQIMEQATSELKAEREENTRLKAEVERLRVFKERVEFAHQTAKGMINNKEAGKLYILSLWDLAMGAQDLDDKIAAILNKNKDAKGETHDG